MARDDQITFIIADLSRYTEREIVALALNIDANLRSQPPIGTPIDTGWASANWVPSVGEPIVLKADNRDPTPGEVALRREEGAQGLNRILAWRIGDGPIFDTNNVPYIGFLNEGHSTQSPPGFVQNALELALVETEEQAATRSGGSDL